MPTVITTFEDLIQYQLHKRKSVAAGIELAFLYEGEIPYYVDAFTWGQNPNGNPPIPMEYLEELQKNERRVFQSRWN